VFFQWAFQPGSAYARRSSRASHLHIHSAHPKRSGHEWISRNELLVCMQWLGARYF